MVDDPFSQFIPFTEIPAYQLCFHHARQSSLPAVDRQPPFRLLVFALLQIRDELYHYQLISLSGVVKLTLSQFSQVFALEQIISLQEDLS